MEETKTECTNCGDAFDEEEVENPKIDHHGDAICDRCYHENYEDICALCEESFDSPERPEDHRFVISEALAKELDMTPGIYQVLDYPFFFGDILSGFDGFFDRSIKLVRAIKATSMKRKECGKHASVEGQNICPECFEKYSRTSGFFAIRTLWVHNRLHQNIYHRGIFEKGE